MSRTIHKILNTVLPHRLKDTLRDSMRPFIPALRHFDMPFRLRQVQSLGFEPKVIHDVGAAGGNWAKLVHPIWPQARIIGFEPNQHEMDNLAKTKAAIPQFEYHRCFLGRTAGEVEYAEHDRQTSLLESSGGKRAKAEVKVLDELIASGAVPPPDFIKLDVQGYELEVLSGATEAMRHARALLLEVSLVPFHKGLPTIDVVLDFMRERGFVWYDIMGILRRPLEDDLWQLDAFFVKPDDPLRLSSLRGWDG